MPDEAPALTPRQERIHRRLQLLGGPAAYFKDACRVLAQAASFDAATPILGNMYREVESAMRAVLLALAGHSPVLPGGPGPSHAEQIQLILTALDLDHGDPRVQAWLHLPGEDGLQEKTHRRGLRPPRPVDPSFWSELEGAFDVVLDAFEARYLAAFTELDRLVTVPCPLKADVHSLSQRVPQNPTTLGYFFSRLQHPAWVPPLRKAGYFEDPPAPVKAGDLGYTLPLWPALDYLARMASHAPLQEEIREIALAVSDTDNLHVHRCLFEIAAALPADMAATLAPRLATFLGRPFSRSLYGPTAALVAHLAANGQGDAALALAREALQVLPVDDPVASRIPGHPRRRVPRLRFDQYGAKQLVEQALPPLVDACGLVALDAFADILDAAVAISHSADRADTEDLSYIWRPAIENHAQNRGFDVRGVLVDAVRDAALRFSGQSPAATCAVVQRFLTRPWKVFRRMAMHVVAARAQLVPDLAAKSIGDRANFDDYQMRHEYHALSAAAFGVIDQETRDRVLSWITDGPDLDAVGIRQEGLTGEPFSDEEAARYKALWQRDRLAAIADHITGNKRALYDDLVARYGAPKHPDFPTYMESGSGDPSPISAEELGSMPITDVPSFLRSWRPSEEDPFGPTRTGLAGALRAAVSAAPGAYAERIGEFRTLPAVFQDAMVEGFKVAAEAGTAFPWEPVLDHCVHMLGAAPESPVSSEFLERFVAPRLTVARMLKDVLAKAQTAPPPELRTKVWGLIHALASDGDPSDDRDGGTGLDAFTRSLNTTRGVAMHAAMEYAEWARNAMGRSATCPGAPLPPELRELLEDRVATDPSPAVRAAIGHAFPFLWYAEPVWAEAQRERVFSDDALGLAAWESYVVFRSPPAPALFRALRPQYLQAVRRATEPREGNRGLEDPHQHLVGHLMPPYWGGELAFGQPDGLLEELFSRAPVALLAYVHEVVGRALANTEGAVPEPERGRIRDLWTRRKAAVLAGGTPPGAGEELAPFGWWFASGKFDESWALAELLSVIEIVRKAEPDHFVLEQLAKTARRHPLPSLRAVRGLVDGAADPWFIDAHAESIEAVIRVALRGGDEGRAMATEFVNRVAARGVLRLRHLLNEPLSDVEEE
jgi:hypothetical protein